MSRTVSDLRFFFYLVVACFCGLLSVADGVVATLPTNVTVIQLDIYNNMDCSGSSSYTSTWNAGNCDSFTTSSYVVYPSSDGAYIISYDFNDANCLTDNITDVVQEPVNVCGMGGDVANQQWGRWSIITKAVNPTDGPLGAFPPTSGGFVSGNQYLNETDSTPSPDCAPTNKNISFVYKPTFCDNEQPYVSGSSQTFRDCDTMIETHIRYSDGHCQVPVRVESYNFVFQSCMRGEPQSCVTTTYPPLPSDLTISWDRFDQNDCTADNRTHRILSAPSACVDYSTYTCDGANGTYRVIYSQYGTVDCSDAPTQVTYISPNICTVDGNGRNLTASLLDTSICSPPPAVVSSSSSSSSSSSTGGTTTGAAVSSSTVSSSSAGTTGNLTTSSSSTGTTSTTSTSSGTKVSSTGSVSGASSSTGSSTTVGSSSTGSTTHVNGTSSSTGGIEYNSVGHTVTVASISSIILIIGSMIGSISA